MSSRWQIHNQLYIQKSHTCEEGGAHLKKQNNFNIYNAAFF